MEDQEKYTQSAIKPTIYEALSRAQASFKSAIKDANNPFFKSKYAPMSSIWDACKDGLADNGLFVSQPPSFTEGHWVVTTKVYNGEGQFIECALPIVVKPNHTPQEFGSALTYARRYSLSSILGIVTDDDDAEGAMARDKPADKAESTPKATEEKPTDDKTWLNKGTAEFDNVKKALSEGYTMAQVKSKYKVSKEVEALLTAA